MPQHEPHNASPYINRIPMYGELNWHSIICENSCGRIRRVLLKMQSPHFARWEKQPQEKPLINTFSLQWKLPQNHFYSCGLQLMGCLNSLCENCLWLLFCVSTVLMHSHSTRNEFSQSEMCPSKLILLFHVDIFPVVYLGGDLTLSHKWYVFPIASVMITLFWWCAAEKTDICI